MSRNDLLLFAALVVLVIGAAHSYLGERHVFARLFELPNLPLLRRDPDYTRQVLRYAWHLTSLAWWGFAAVLLVLWLQTGDVRHTMALIVAGIFLLTAIIVLVTAGRRHPAWPLCLIVAAAAWYGA